MADETESLIKEIAIKHGIALGRDDPILILQTLNAHLMANNAYAQQVMLGQYKEELEGIALRWGNDTKEKSERILNASLTASKEAMAKLLQESAIATANATRQEIDASLSHVLRKSERIAMLNLIASGIALLAGCTILLSVFFH